jgi:predicted CoA-binding protein
MSFLADIRSFLSQKRIAIVGVSRDPKSFSRMLFNEFVERGYDVVPVNLNGGEIDGRHCFTHANEIVPAPEAVLLMTPDSVSEELLRECRKAGIANVWIYGYSGRSKVSPPVLAEVRGAGIRVIDGECPLMFFPRNGIHRVHGFVRKILRSYPS